MDIYIGNLPNQVNSSDLRKVINTVMLPNNFRELLRQLVNRKERVSFSEIDVIENHMGGHISRFAHAVIIPDRAAKRLLARMDHLTFKGKSLRVREYSERNDTNDRRNSKNPNLFAVGIYNRRHGDRRGNFSKQAYLKN